MCSQVLSVQNKKCWFSCENNRSSLMKINEAWEQLYKAAMSRGRESQVNYLSLIAEKLRNIPTQYLIDEQALFIPNDDYVASMAGPLAMQDSCGFYYSGESTWSNYLIFPIIGMDSTVKGIGGFNPMLYLQAHETGDFSMPYYSYSAKSLFPKEEIESTDLRLYESMELDSLKKMLVQFRLTNKMRESIDKYLRGDWERFDNYFDFFEIDMSCPTDGETPMEIGQGTSYEKPSVSLATYPCKDTFTALWSQYIEEMQDLERIMIASTRIPKYDEHVDAQLCASLYTVVTVDNQYITKDVIKRHKEFITIALGDTGSELLLDLEMDSESREQGQLSSGDSAKEVKELSVDDIMNEDSDEIDLDSLDEIQ